VAFTAVTDAVSRTIQKESLMSMQIAMIAVGVAALAFLTVGGVFALGLYLGWFNIGPGSKTAKNDFTFTMDEDRVEELKHRAHTAKQDLECHAEDHCAVPAENTNVKDAAPVKSLPT